MSSSETARSVDAGERTDDRCAENFTRLGTVGVEEELVVVDQACRPTAGAERLVYGADPPRPLAGRLDHEMYRCIVETKTPVCEDADGVRREVTRIRNALVRHAGRNGYGIAAAGVHPAARPADLDVSARRKYRTMLDRFRYPQWRNTTAGLHVHVGVDDADKAVWVANELRWYLPLVLALSANSPFHVGTDTGLASARANVFEELPHTGPAPTFDSYDAYVDFQETMLATGSIDDPGELWWDARPHGANGTVEIRAPDAQRDVESVAAFTEYARAVVLDLAARYEDGESATDVRRAFLEENKWRATRDGHAATFVEHDGLGTVPVAELVDDECDRLGVSGIRDVLGRESGAAMQRRLHRTGGMNALCAGLRLRERARAEERSPSGPNVPGRDAMPAGEPSRYRGSPRG